MTQRDSFRNGLMARVLRFLLSLVHRSVPGTILAGATQQNGHGSDLGPGDPQVPPATRGEGLLGFLSEFLLERDQTVELQG
jgi:hypothetical protein